MTLGELLGAAVATVVIGTISGFRLEESLEAVADLVREERAIIRLERLERAELVRGWVH